MSNSLNGAVTGLKKTFSALTSVATVLSLSGAAYLAPLATSAAVPSDYGLKEGDTISAAGTNDPDIYIVNEQGYKRLFLNPVIFGFYGHLGGFANVKNVTAMARDAFPTSGLFRNCETNDEKVYGVETTGEDTGILHWVNTSGAQAVADDPNFFKKVFCINNNEFNWYAKGSNYTSVNQVPSYSRTPGATPTPVPSGPLSVSLAPANPGPQTITLNAVGVEMLRVRVNGSGTVNTLTIKRLGAGQTDDFDNIFVYQGASRLTSGKSFSSATGEVTFLLDSTDGAVNGTKDYSIVADMASANTAGNVNYLQLTSMVATGGAAISGTPLSGNNFTTSGTSSGTIDTAEVGSLSNPTVGQKQAQLAEFKLTANTEGASVKRLTLLNGGTVKPADLTNVKVKTGATEWSGTVTSDSYFVFDLGSGYTIAKGGNATFKVYADVGGKKDETIDLYFENNSDLLAVGDQYGQGMAEGTNTLDTADEATTLTLQGGALTLVFNGPNASTVGTTATDVTLLRYSMTAASNIEVKKTEFTLCADQAGDGTYDTETTEADWDDVTDFKVWNEDTNTVVIGPKDATSFDHADDTASCPAGGGVQESFTDVLDLMAGTTYNFKVTADINTANVTGELIDGSIIRAILDDYSDDAGDVTVAKYSGTNTSVAAADIVPRADINGPNITLSASALTLSLAGNPSDQTKIRGTKDVDAVGITFAASQASALKVTTIKITGVTADTAGDTYDEGTPDNDNDSGISVANAMSTVRLYESSGALIADSSKVTNNSLGTAGTGTMTFGNLDWNIPAGTSKTMLVRVDLSNNQASGTAGDLYAFDIAATGDVTALDSDSNTVNPGAASAGVNGGLTPTQVLTVKNSGSMTLATSADSPVKGAVYWGQTNAPISKFRLSATDEGQYIEKLTIAASVAAEKTDAAANVKEVILSYKNKAGSTITRTQSFGNAASVNFNWESTDVNRPYVPQDGSLDISVNANMKTKSEGATQLVTAAQDVFFSLDLVDKFNGSHVNGFRAVGEGSGTVLDGTGTNINDVLGAFDQYVYRVFPKIEQVALSSPYSLLGTPVVFKFSVTAMGAPGSNLRFDNQHNSSGSINFEIVASGQSNVNTTTSTTFSVLDENGTIIDTGTLRSLGTPGAADTSQTISMAAAASGVQPGLNSSISFNFTSQDIEIPAGGTRTFSIRLDNPNQHYGNAGATGRAPDYFQVTLLDDQNNLINWVADYDGSTNSLDQGSTTGVLRSVPLYGPTFQR
ncbi:MAG: hypothetical protein UX31_C0001G0004 [Candidatus Nomurabacteria bacterium GW2011_GWA1_46_11]|uniref:Uncharacterized protein n=1 Tax=Candidatus Nomurabacteria bacterium GW2011_GWA1_46_11 TaxID=1618732 RepID=A0A0G1NPY5_9BACT|nr:MAG: hypothetical protein UX31_C0001G0004 [Candidatus Nomurabacteria bacterium GW2011_GWA1_46_11]